MEEGEGFEPPLPYSNHGFESCALNHSAILPIFGTRGGTRTLTPFQISDFKSDAAANYATRVLITFTYYIKTNKNQ